MAGWPDRWRRLRAGLSVLLALALFVSQAVAAPLSSVPALHGHGHGQMHSMMAPASATPDESGSPCKDCGDTQRLACCIAGACTMLVPFIAGGASGLAPVGFETLSYRHAVMLPVAGMAATPALPPPRRMV